jgi:hypothetical protein
MSAITDAWNKFKIDVIPEDALDVQVESMEIAFYAGLNVMQKLHCNLGNKDTSEDQALVSLISWDTEIQNFFKRMAEEELH